MDLHCVGIRRKHHFVRTAKPRAVIENLEDFAYGDDHLGSAETHRSNDGVGGLDTEDRFICH